MADFLTPFWTDLRGAIGVGAPLVLPANSGGGIWRVVTVEKVDWENVTAPFCVVTLRMILDGSSPITCDVYEVTAEIYYIVADSTSIAETIDAVLMTIKDALKAYAWSAGSDFLDVLEYDSSENNRANQVLLARNEPYSAGLIVVQFRLGETG